MHLVNRFMSSGMGAFLSLLDGWAGHKPCWLKCPFLFTLQFENAVL